MINVVRVQLVRDKNFKHIHKQVTTADIAIEIAKDYMEERCNMDRENMVLLCLDCKMKVTAIHTLSTGTATTTVVNPLEIFRVCILSGAGGFILAHNHPTGVPTPSKEDIEVTKKIDKAAEVMGLSLIDHIILGDGTNFSMKTNEII